jgi:hypothetical protein
VTDPGLLVLTGFAELVNCLVRRTAGRRPEH